MAHAATAGAPVPSVCSTLHILACGVIPVMRGVAAVPLQQLCVLPGWSFGLCTSCPPLFLIVLFFIWIILYGTNGDLMTAWWECRESERKQDRDRQTSDEVDNGEACALRKFDW